MTLRMLRASAGAAALAALIGPAILMAQQPTPAAPVGNAKAGQTLFLKIGCFQCHGNEGQGGAAGPRIGRSPMLAIRNFTAYIRAPRGEMPPYTAKVLADKDIADIYAYLASLPPPLPLESIPLLKVTP
jgi:ubiquinol-cytochrome c reductase cytochrome c subunit